MKIAFAGEKGAYAELAAVQYFGTSHTLVPVQEFDDVFSAVSRGKVVQGIIPIENSLTGSIHQNYDLLLKSDLFIAGEIFLRVSHYFIANHGVKPHNIKRVFSHPQGLAQCQKFLKKLSSSVERVPVSNTAVAVRKIKDDQLLDAAAIGSLQAALDYDMNVLAESIEDNKANITRFLILSKKKSPPKQASGNLKTSVVFSLKNLPGALFRGLSVFALRDIDLLKIESRPVHGKPFEYLFYLDFAGGFTEERQKNALNHLKEITVFCRMLGSYGKGKLVHPEYKKR